MENKVYLVKMIGIFLSGLAFGLAAYDATGNVGTGFLIFGGTVSALSVLSFKL